MTCRFRDDEYCFLKISCGSRNCPTNQSSTRPQEAEFRALPKSSRLDFRCKRGSIAEGRPSCLTERIVVANACLYAVARVHDDEGRLGGAGIGELLGLVVHERARPGRFHPELRLSSPR